MKPLTERLLQVGAILFMVLFVTVMGVLLWLWAQQNLIARVQLANQVVQVQQQLTEAQKKSDDLQKALNEKKGEAKKPCVERSRS